MTDLQAAIGLIELDRYEENLARRRQIFEQYDLAFKQKEWAITPFQKNEQVEGCYHLYLLRIAGITEAQRDAIMQFIFDEDVSVNVHFQPLPLLTAYKNLGYQMEDYPNAWKSYSNEISLPVYFDLSDTSVQRVIDAVISAVERILN